MEIRQIEPEERRVSLEGMYLSHRLQELSKRIVRPIVVANYVTDLNDMIAVEGVRGSPEELKNPSDWRLFQELTAQADAIITGASYMTEFEENGESVQNVLTQFDKGSNFEDLGDWREQNGLKRNPDLVVVSRSLNFSVPDAILESGRKILIFTTDRMQNSENGEELEKAGATVIGAGEEGVDGAVMIERLGQEGYGVIKMITGPRVLKILMVAEFTNQEGEVIRRGALDRLYITRVDRKITEDLSTAITVLEGRKVDDLASEGGCFRLIQRYAHDKVTGNDGVETSQEFLVFERRDIASGSPDRWTPNESADLPTAVL
ncbi:MAG: hypothetical protein BMS9Abin28_0620 [Anaerolineae bacterium]|nr:MAG: hypothetical protein BMS9Abin28_0620 [Anaerolineae bacterium]